MHDNTPIGYIARIALNENASRRLGQNDAAASPFPARKDSPLARAGRAVLL